MWLLVNIDNSCAHVILNAHGSDVSADYLQSLASTLSNLITNLTTSPQTILRDQNCLSKQNRQLFESWNQVSLESTEKCIHDLIYEQVLANPEHEAVCAWDGTLTYQNLWRYAIPLAHTLVALGVGPEVTVPLCFDKSVWATVAMLAVLEAGGAFCPLDATQPIPRLEGLVSRLGAKVLLCSRQHTQKLSSVAEKILAVDAEAIERLPDPPRQRSSRVAPHNVAYILWTSGSTGEPKGVVVEHRAYCSAVKAQTRDYRVSQETRFLQYASYVFDASILETLTPLMIGATTCVPSEHARLNDLSAAINQLRANFVELTPSTVSFLEPSGVPGVKTLQLMGEVMSKEQLSKWSHLNLFNGYGPAECSVAATVNTNVPFYKQPTMIGKGMGVKCWLVDPEDHDKLVPPGCVAELLIEGPTLARGYLRDEAKTLDAFIVDPKWAVPAGNVQTHRRMYKTGDLVRHHTSHGMLFFVGRKDTQVKLHGQRIELGEIQHHLSSDPDLWQSMIVLPKVGLCAHRLVAVVALEQISKADGKSLRLVDRKHQDHAKATIDLVRDRLSKRLPAFMLPSIWLAVDSMPLLSSGKVDRKIIMNMIQDLPEDDFARWVHVTESNEQPATEFEGQLRSIWSHVLNLRPDQIGLQSSFLSLGGDSISAMMVQSQCKKRSVGITVQDILRAKSIRHLATFARASNRSTKYEEKIEEEFDLSPIQSLYFEVPRNQPSHFNQSCHVRLTNSVQPATLQSIVKTIVNRHSMLRARFQISNFDDEWKQRVTTDVVNSYAFRTHSHFSKEQAVEAMARSQASLDPVNGPLFAVDLFNLGDESQQLFLTAHHLVVDLVSWRVILEEIEELLLDPQAVTRLESPLPFQAWCKMQMEHAHKTPPNKVLPNTAIPKQTFSYWGIEQSQNLYGKVDSEKFELGTDVTQMISSKCHSSLRTDVVDVLITSMIHSFSKVFTDRVGPTIFNEGHGREVWDPEIDLSKTVGWFTTMYPIYVASSPADKFVDTLRKVKDFRRAVPANGRPYFASRLLTSKGAKKFGAHWPLEVTFNYLGIYQQLERADALLQPVEQMAGEARAAGGNADVGHETPRFGLFEISAVIVQGRLRYTFTFNRNIKHREKIRDWVLACEETLNSMPPKLVKMAYQPTLSDFPLLSLDYDGLEQLITRKLPEMGVTNMSNVEDIYRCSQIQQGLLISKQRDEAYYAIHGTYEVKPRDGSRVDSSRLEHAWQRVVDRHPSLRTVFVESLSEGDALYDQVVLKNVTASVAWLDCETEADVTPVFDSQRPMQANSSTPSHRFTICETSTGKVFCKMELSHVIVDGSSISTLFQELVSTYEGRTLSDSGPLYSNYIKFLQDLPPQVGIGYWRSYLDGVEPTSFPVLHDAVSSERELRSLHFDWSELGTLQSFCDLHGVTLANIFHTAWALTLRCYTGSDDVCYGYLMSARDPSIEGISDLVGYLVNMLICRVTLLPNTSLVSLMHQVQKDLGDGQAHAQTALSEVLHALKISGTSLFNTSLSYRKLPLAVAGEQHEISFQEHAPYHDPTEYSVSINIEVSEDRAAIDLDYWTDCLSDGNARNVADTFVQAIRNITEQAEDNTEQLPRLSDADFQQILAWNSDMPETIERCVHEVVAEQTTTQPSAQAICAWDAKFTYAELDTLAEKLAVHLIDLGVGPESFVCLCCEKSAYTIVCMLAVLKAGGAFVSLDPMHPKAALEWRIKDTKAEVILTSPCYHALFADLDLNVASVDRAFLDKLVKSESRDRDFAHPHNPCCVIYTSGSTGKPKGVVLEHKALVTSSRAHGSALGVGPDTRFLQFSSYTFDNSLEEIFTTLMRGGTVCVPSDHDRMNDLAGAVSRLEANFMDLTPTVATYLNPSEMPTVKGLALGGEALTKTVLEVWGEVVPIHNQYGPSECTINSSHRTDITKSSDPASIGRSVGSVSWIVDPSDHNQLVAIGREGELLIEGPILARGYLNDPAKTAKAFIADPSWTRDHRSKQKQSSAAPGPRRMYMTGDLVRYNSDGTMAYIGRKDQQVKLHGQRIELGEIEYHARVQLPGEWHFAVELVVPGGSSDAGKALAVFVCPETDSGEGAAAVLEGGLLLAVSAGLQATFKELEGALAKSIPKHMVPSLYIPLAKLPLTSSGKLDRKQLHALAKSMTENQVAMYRLAGSSGRAPSSAIEKTLAGLWESVLGLEPGSVGMDAQFFRVGGDSIAAIRLVTAARASKISLTVADIFRNATLTEMCRNSNVSDGSAADVVIPAYTPFGLLPEQVPYRSIIGNVSRVCGVETQHVEDIYPCTSMQAGLMALSSKQPGAYVARNRFRLVGVDLERLKRAWETVIAEEGILRTRIVFTESLGFIQVVVKQAPEWYDEYAEEGAKAVIPAHDGGRLTKYSIDRQSGDSHWFTWTIHHALYDGWSVALILNKVQAYYKELSVEKAAPYSRFMQYLSTLKVTDAEEFWQQRLVETTSSQFPKLPKPSYQPSGTSLSTSKMPISWKKGADFTVPTLIRAAWALTLSAYSNTEDVVFGETVAGRDAPVPGIVDIAGPTFSSIPLRISTSRNLSLTSYLQNVQTDLMDALPHQHIGLQRIKRLNSATAKACDFQNLIAINSNAPDANDNLWKLESSGDVGTDFFTYALTISFDIGRADLQTSAHYDPEVISEWQLGNLMRYFESTLARMNASVDASCRLDDLRTIHAEDEARIERWNSGGVTSVDACIQDLITEKAKGASGSLPAVDAWDAQYTYLKLEQLANSLARQLYQVGIQPKSHVPICFDKSAVTVVAMLAIMKLSAAFVPIDSEAPEARLKAIVQDLDATHILCSPRNKALCGSLGPEAIAVDLETIAKCPKNAIKLPTCDYSDTAYVVFTSGSTGKPKGTLVSHSAFVSGALAHGPAMRMQSSSRVLQFASYIFDASIMEIFSTLILGGCVCVPSDVRRLNDTAAVINEMNVNWALLTPSFVRMIETLAVPGLKTLVLGGEAVSQSHVTTWAERTHLVNAYGPSETAVVATVNPHVGPTSDPTNIGRAVGSHCFITNQYDHEELVPVGAIGELVVAGPILASGYLKNEAKTAEAFVSVPRWMQKYHGVRESCKGKIYKTGDLVKYASNGSLLYCGRKDSQTKLHGQRLELGDVEHHLMQDGCVQHVLAMIPSSGVYEKRLVAALSYKLDLGSDLSYNGLSLISGRKAANHVRTVREYLASRLQPYMIPSSWIVLSKIPMLPSGKLDRRQIADAIASMPENLYQELSGADTSSSSLEGTDLEQRLQKVWSKVLNLPSAKIGFDKGFLFLGGDSISALHVLSQCRADGMSVTVQDIIRSQSISDLASHVTLPQKRVQAEEKFGRPFGLSPIQRLFFEWVGDQTDHFNQSVMVQLTQRRSLEEVSAAVVTLVKSHSMLRAHFQKSDSEKWCQVIDKEVGRSHSFRSHLDKVSSAHMTAEVAAGQKSLDIRKGPIFVVDLFESEDTGMQVLSLIAHHLVIDVISWSIILDDLEDLLVDGKAKAQPSLPFQVWNRLQDKHSQTELSKGLVFDAEVPNADYAYWGMANKSNSYGDACNASIELDAATSRNLLGPCHQALQTELVDILLGAILFSFCRAFPDRKSPPAVFNEAHGREPWDADLDLSHTIGWFTTISPVFVVGEAVKEKDVVKIIEWIKDVRSRVPHKGRQYFAHRMLTEDGRDKCARHWPMEAVFNYLGHEKQFKKQGALLQPLDEMSPFDIGTDVPRLALFEISASIVNEKLKLSVAYNKHSHRQAGIKSWIVELEKTLSQASSQLLEAQPRTTLSSFPLVPLGYNAISKLQQRLPSIGVSSVSELQNVYSCSPMQRGILLSQIKDNNRYMYSSIFLVQPARSISKVDVGKFAKAWEAVVQRHSSLRTVFFESISREGLMDQAVVAKVSPKVLWISCDEGKEVETLNEQEPMSYADPQPHHQLTICETKSGQIVFKFEISHAICDGTSIPIILDELSAFYQSSNELTQAPALYSDFVSHIQNSSYDEDVGYWRRYLENVEPCDFPSLNDGQKHARELRVFELEIRNLTELQAFCTQQSATFSNVLQLVWCLLLRTYTGSESVCFGYLSSGRDVPVQGIDRAVGLFISMLVCRMDVGNGMSVFQALEQIQTDYAQSTAHQAYSLGEMQHELQLSGKSLFNTAFTFQRRSETLHQDDQQISFDVLEAHDPSEYDLTVNVEADKTGVHVHFNYWTDFLSDSQAKNVADTFDQILASIVTQPREVHQTIGAIGSCAESHRKQIAAWNSKPLPLVDQCVHDIINQRTQSLPKSTPSVCSWDVDLTYAELISLSKRLAKHLISLDVGPESYIPICFEKSAWAVVGIMGVLQAGAAFVPLDPSHPDDRIKFILDSISASVVLCSRKTSEKFRALERINSFVVDETLTKKPQPFVAPVVKSPSPSNAAYLIFTSGTTGLPKGTIISHRAFATGATEHAPQILMSQRSRVLQFSNLSFDASVMEVLTSLMTGACICIPSDEERMNDIPGAINRMSVNWTLLTPSVVNVLKPERVPSLEVLVTGGEAMQAKHIARWSQYSSLVNAYGPSECSVIATTSIKISRKGFIVNEDPANIGHAVGCRSWVVDAGDHHKLVPIGSIGELVVEGNSIARGYLNNEAQTAKAFVVRPTWLKVSDDTSMEAQSEMVYKTGDLVRYNSDGSVNYVGRKDTQIKLNGLRIELGEIEHQVKQNLPEKIQAAVEMVAPAGQKTVLAVFITSAGNETEAEVSREPGTTLLSATITEADFLLLTVSHTLVTLGKKLKTDLAGSLPAYMIPTLFVPLSKMPWTSSGKLDRSRLRKMIARLSIRDTAPFKLQDSVDKRAPSTEMETKLRELWAEILRQDAESISADDSFFVLGGDSVQAMRLVAAARGIKISLSVLDIFRKPSLCDMAAACSSLADEDETALKPFGLLSDVDPIDQLLDEIATQSRVERSELADAYPCSSLQAGLVTLSVKQPGSYVAHNVFRLPEAVAVDQFKMAWQTAIEEMDILRTRIINTSMSTFVQAVIHKDVYKWHTAETVTDATDSMPQLPEYNGSQLMRFTLVAREGETDRYFVLSIHHAIYDGWSMPRMLQRVEDIYFGELEPPTKAHYSKFIKYLNEADSEASDRFWRARFDGLQAVHFPKVANSAAQEQGSSQTLKYSLNISQKPALTSITMPSIIRAAWAILMAAHTGSEDVVFGETLTGRDIPIDGIIDMLGPTLTTVPTRLRVDNALRVTEFLKEVHHRATEVIPHQHVGLSRIRQLSAETATAADFQNLLVIQTAQDDSAGKMWDPVNTGVGSNFFTYPLVLECTASESTVHIDAHYHDGTISKWHVEKLTHQFETVLLQLLSLAPERDLKMSDLQVISKHDMEMIQDWNKGSHSPATECIHDLFLHQAELIPKTQAVCAWDGNFTYRELRDHATKLSYHLQDLGVAPEVLVPFCMDKSKWAVVAQLGILIANGAMVPLDPAHPSSRHAEIIKDTKASILICSPQYQERYVDMVETIIPLNEQLLSELSSSPPALVPALPATSRNTAYVIFTSGSTGRPKGVVIEHEAFCSSSEAYCTAMLMKPGARVFNFASVTFDVGLMENMSPLIIGACVCVPSNEAKMMDIASAMNDLRATWAFLTPSVANLIDPAAVPALKVLVCGGEAMSMENVLKWADQVTLVNGYGPTEASVITVVNDKVSQQKNPSIIGFGHSNCHTWIVNAEDSNCLVPLGCVGELLLEGPILAREYLHDNEKTAKAFISDPSWISGFSNSTGSSRRMYKTGDLATYNEDGGIIYLGRKDNQVKFHGQRIELGEIEHNIEIPAQTQHTVTLLPKTGLCKDKLVTVISLAEISVGSKASAANECVLLRDESQLEKADGYLMEIQDFVSEQLPTYMVPSIWIIVEAIPLLVSGKLDRKQVEKWVENISEVDYQFITDDGDDNADLEPITETVQKLMEIWAYVFNIPVERVNLNQSFMSQGGDSLISMSIIARCRKIGIVLGLQEILQSKSLFQLAKLVDSKDQESSKAVAMSSYEEKVDVPFDLSPVQQLYFQLAGSSKDHTRDGRFNQSQMLRLNWRVKHNALDKALGIIVQQHSMFRARFTQNATGFRRQQLTSSVSGSYRFEEYHVKDLAGILPIFAASQRSLDLENGPLFAVESYITKQGEQVLSFVAHHLVIDVVSWGIILQQLQDLLSDPSETIEKPLSFQVWCAMQNDHANQRPTSEVKNVLPFNIKRADIGFWGMVDRPNKYGNVRHESFLLDKASTQLALGKANKSFRTQPLEILVSAMIYSFRRQFPQRATPTIFNEGHGRDAWDASIDLARTTGWFTSISPLHVSVEKNDDTSIEVLKRVKDFRRAIPANGREYFAHRFLTTDGRWRFSGHAPMEILFNYTGRAQSGDDENSLFQPISIVKSEDDEKLIADVGSEATRMALFEISASVSDDRLQMSFMYNKDMDHQTEIQQWVASCQRTLRDMSKELANLSLQPTLSDYPLLPTTYAGLAKHLNETFPEIGVSSLDEVEDMLLCAPTQEGLLLAQLRDPQQYVNFVISEIQLSQESGRVDVQRLVKAWQKVVDRHQSLRTAFVYSVCKGHAFDQIVMKRAAGGAKVIHCEDSQLWDRFKEVSLREVNKTRRPMLPHQLTICTTTSGKAYTKLELNHAVIDGGSGALMTRDLSLAYEGRLSDGPKPLYSDYIKYITNKSGTADVSFWKKYLSGIERCYLPNLKGDGGERKTLHALYMKFDRWADLQAFCRSNELTLSNILLAAWGLVLRKYTSRDDVCFGNLTAGRDAPVEGIQDQVGAFINMLVCRVNLAPTRALKDVFRKVQSDYLDMLPYQHTSLARIQHDLGFSGEPLYNTAASIQNQISTRDSEKEGDAIEFEPITDHDPTEVSEISSPRRKA